jgi:6-phosphogluconolactonase (cycloisomerase 2 family)
MKRLIGYTAVLCLLALTVGCGGVTSSGTLAYISNSTGTGFTVYTVNTNGTLTTSSISPQTTPAAPLVIQFSANGKWAYFLDHTGKDTLGRPTGSTIYAYTRAGNGTLSTFIGTFAVNGATSLVIAPNNLYVYVAEPDVAVPGGQTGELAIYAIDPSTGILSTSAILNVGYSIEQLVMNSSGSLLFGLSTSQQTVVSWTLNASSGSATQVSTLPVGTVPDYMVLAANGNFMYILDATATTPNYPNVALGGAPGSSPNFYAYSVASTGILSGIPGQPGQPLGVFNENADLQTGIFPQNPIGGVTSNDSRFLFIANQGGTQGSSISVFRIEAVSGEPSEVLGSLTTVGGITTSSESPFPCGCTGASFAAIAKTNNTLYVLDEAAGKVFQFEVDQNLGVIRALVPPSQPAESATSSPTWITLR